MLKACIFDLDGVIVDTAIYHYRAWKKLANELGFDFTHLQNEQLKGISRLDSLELVLQWGKVNKTAEEKAELARRKNEWYVEMIDKMTPSEILPGVQKLIAELKNQRIKLALGSASRNSSLILKRTGTADFFDVVVDGNSVSRSKPDPQVFLQCAEFLGVEPANCLVLEDAVAGVEAAHRAGMKALGIGDPEILTKADQVVIDLDHTTVEDLKSLMAAE